MISECLIRCVWFHVLNYFCLVVLVCQRTLLLGFRNNCAGIKIMGYETGYSWDKNPNFGRFTYTRLLYPPILFMFWGKEWHPHFFTWIIQILALNLLSWQNKILIVFTPPSGRFLPYFVVFSTERRKRFLPIGNTWLTALISCWCHTIHLFYALVMLIILVSTNLLLTTGKPILCGNKRLDAYYLPLLCTLVSGARFHMEKLETRQLKRM